MKSTSPSYKYRPYRCRESLGSSASLNSRSKPRDLRELKKTEWEDRRARSSTRTRTRRSVGLSTLNEEHKRGRTESIEMRAKSFAIARVLDSGTEEEGWELREEGPRSM